MGHVSRVTLAVYNFLVQQFVGYRTAIGETGASTAAGATEGALMNRGLDLLSKILPWLGEKMMADEAHDFLPVGTFFFLSSGVFCLENVQRYTGV